MPFFLYQHWQSESGSLTFRRVKQVALGGKSGPIAAYVTDECGAEPGYRWHMTSERLLEQLCKPTEHAVLIDLKPKAKGNVSLYRLTDIWGFSYREWTPMCLRLETFFRDKMVRDPDEYKREFEFQAEDHSEEIIHEFLYLNGGTSEGTWNWGMAGSVNGALLFQDAWEYLANQVRYE